jgi:hypothetical protein
MSFKSNNVDPKSLKLACGEPIIPYKKRKLNEIEQIKKHLEEREKEKECLNLLNVGNKSSIEIVSLIKINGYDDPTTTNIVGNGTSD